MGSQEEKTGEDVGERRQTGLGSTGGRCDTEQPVGAFLRTQPGQSSTLWLGYDLVWE